MDGNRFVIKYKTKAIKIVYILVNGIVRGLRSILWTQKRPQEAKRVCVYKIGNIGDIVCALPAISAIREAYPNAHLTVVSSPGKRGMPGAKEILKDANWVDDLYIYYKDQIDTFFKSWEMVNSFRERKFDVWIELAGNMTSFQTTLRNMVFARLSGAKWGFGWRVSTIKVGAQFQSANFKFPNEVDRTLEILKDAGIKYGKVKFPLPLKSEHFDNVTQLFKTHGLNGKRIVAIAPGAKKSTNRWPPDRFSEVGRYLTENGFSIVALGGHGDHEICDVVLAGVNAKSVNLAGKTCLLESAEVLKRCELLICNDSGVQHLAAAVGTPSISIFSFQDIRGKWFPFGNQNKILQEWVECHTCFLEKCPHDNKCINMIESENVIEAIDELTHSGNRSCIES